MTPVCIAPRRTLLWGAANSRQSPQSPSRERASFVPRSSTNGIAVKTAKQDLLLLYKYLESKGNTIEVALGNVMEDFHQRNPPKELEAAMRYCTKAQGGRHLSTICIAACELVGGNETQALPMACVVELWMAVILAMDDLPCLDDAKLRKGLPAAHIQFGETTALLGTQSLLILAFESLVKPSQLASVNPVQRLRLAGEFSQACQRLVWGQFEDVKLSSKDDVTLELLQRKNEKKTSSFFELPLVTGAILGGASEEKVEGLRRYGKYFGLMWQVNDDISDASMSSEEMGKDSGSDSKHDKPTYLTLLGMEASIQLRDELANKAKKELLKHFGHEEAKVLLAIVEATRRFGSIYNNTQLLQKLGK